MNPRDGVENTRMATDPATFLARFAAAEIGAEPLSFQLLFFDPPALTEAGLLAALAPHLPGVTVELLAVAGSPEAASVVSADGPPASALGLIAWPGRVVKLVTFDAPMPYGPVEACVGPALIPPPMKVDAAQHRAHALLYIAGNGPEPLEGYTALCAVAGALARFGGIVTLNEEARTAVPAFDLIPDEGEDALQTYRTLPTPYLFGGFVRMDAGHAGNWVRTFACHRLGLPNLAMKMTDPDHGRMAFQTFAGILGYLRQVGEAFTAGDLLDLGDGTKFTLRVPAETEWFLDSPGPLFVLEPEA